MSSNKTFTVHYAGTRIEVVGASLDTVINQFVSHEPGITTLRSPKGDLIAFIGGPGIPVYVTEKNPGAVYAL